MNILVIDIGGTNVKVLASGQREPRSFGSHDRLEPLEMVERVKYLVQDWVYDKVSIGVPGAVGPAGAELEPGNLGDGWIGFDFESRFKKPVRLVNDAAMQALGAYEGDRMLFLGLGTGLGSALVTDGVIVPLELGSLPYRPGETLADRLGKKGLIRLGLPDWNRSVHEITGHLKVAFKADYVTLGGGNAVEVDPLPPQTRRGGNADAFTGGFRLWSDDVELHGHERRDHWRVVR